jgi:hypothetical protein
MFTKEDILARLQNGESIDAIAKELTSVINEANKAFVDEKAKKEAALIQEKEELQAILIDLFDWMGKHYNMDVSDVKAHLTAEQAIDLMDSCKEYFDAINELKQLTFPAKPVVKVKTSASQRADDIINQFLESKGW